MKKTRFAVIADCIFTFFALWLLFTCVFKFLSLNLPAAASAAFFTAAALSLILFYVLSSLRKKKILKKKEEEEKDSLSLHLSLSSDEYVCSLVKNIFDENYKISLNTLIGGRERIVPLFRMQPASADVIAEAVKRYSHEELTFLCNDLSPEGRSLAEKLNLKVIYIEEIYLKLKKQGCLPEKYILSERRKRTFKDKLKLYLSKGNCKPFFWCGAGLLFFSLFALFPLYYIISGSALVLISLFIKIFSYRRAL